MNLIITAHPDDEILLAFNLLHKVNQHHTIVCVTNGNDKRRKKHFEKVIGMLGHSSIILNGEDRRFSEEFGNNSDIKQRLSSLIRSKAWNKIITHNLAGEYFHAGHIGVSRLVHNVCKETKTLNKLYTFANSQHSLSNCTKQQTKKYLKIYQEHGGYVQELFDMGYNSFNTIAKFNSNAYINSLKLKNLPICKKIGAMKSSIHPINKYFDEVIVLHLRNHRESAKRFKQTHNELAKEGIVGYTYPAILGTNLTVENTKGGDITPGFAEQALRSRSQNPKGNPGGFGQMMSFIRVLKYIVDAPHVNKVLFFEDDFKLNAGFKSRFTKYMRDVPEKWDLVYLGMSSNHRKPYLVKNLNVNKPEYLKYNNEVSENVIIPKGGTGLYSVAISKQGAKKLLKKLLPIKKDTFDYTKFAENHLHLNIPLDEFPTIASLDVYISKLFPQLKVYYLRNKKHGDLVDFKTGKNNPSTINLVQER